jgi:signal peptidase II
VLVIAIDQVSKFWVIAHLQGQEPISFIPGVIELIYTENTGIAFSMFNDRPELLVIFNTLIILVLIVWAIRTKGLNLGLCFIVAGGIGNLLDRFLHGYVIDFINPVFVQFAVFNLADVALNIGVFLLVWNSIKK